METLSSVRHVVTALDVTKINVVTLEKVCFPNPTFEISKNILKTVEQEEV